MRELQVDDSKLRAVYYTFATVMMGVGAVLVDGSWRTPLFGLGALVSGWMAWRYFVAQAVYVDGDEVLVMPRKSDPVRFALEEVVSARTSPLVYHQAWVVLRHNSGGTVRTIIRDEDLTWLMSLMPEAALTGYWRRKVSV